MASPAQVPPSGNAEARAALVRILRQAHAGEHAAAIAYRGHGRSVREPRIRKEIRRIRQEELDHRTELRGCLQHLGNGPARGREIVMPVVGFLVAVSCFVGGRALPMYGAGRIERANVAQYLEAARLARLQEEWRLEECLLRMADVEQEHERFFLQETARTRAGRLLLAASQAMERGSRRHGVARSSGAGLPERRFRRPKAPCT